MSRLWMFPQIAAQVSSNLILESLILECSVVYRLEFHSNESRVCEIASPVLIKELTQFDRQGRKRDRGTNCKLTIILYAGNRTHRRRTSHNCK